MKEATTHYVSQLAQLGAIVSALCAVDLDSIGKEVERTESLAPIFAPTAYQRNKDHFGCVLQVVRAAKRFRRELEEIERRSGAEGWVH